jgi:hypothetical protein
MNPMPGAFWNDDCARGGGFGINAGSLPANTSTGVELFTPPTIAIRRIRVWMVVRLRSSTNQLFAVAVNGDAAGSHVVDLFGSPGGSTLAAPYESALLPADTSYYMVFVNCAGAIGDPCTPVDTNVLDVRGIETTLEENVAPTGTVAGGELLSGNSQSGIKALAFNVADQDSGVAAVSVLLGSTIAGIADFTSDCAFVDFAACPAARSGSVAVDTRKVADGIYPVAIRIKDAAGNEETVTSPTAIQVANGSTATGFGQASKAARLTASFARNHRGSTTVGYGRRVRIRGRLLAPDSTPLAGATLHADELPASRFRERRTAVLTTAADGSFEYTARPGPSRTIELTYPGSEVSRQLHLRVKASATLAVKLLGTLVRYRGRVVSTPIPRRGKLVEIQGRAPGAGWKTFARRRTTRRGAYSGTYRLRIHRPGVRLQFRVRVPRERGYPFVAHAGRAVGRTVR